MNKKFLVKDARLPNLGTILMVEDFLKKQKKPISTADIRNNLPKKVMHQTLKIILQYLIDSRKISYDLHGIKWIFDEK